MSTLSLRTMTATGLLALSALALAACASTAASAAPADDLLVVRDSALRPAGADCSGAGSLLYIHAGARLSALTTDGEEVLNVELPAGVAVQSDARDFGNAPRVPSRCEFAIDAHALDPDVAYEFRVDDRSLGMLTLTPNGVDVAVVYPALGDPYAASPTEDD